MCLCVIKHQLYFSISGLVANIYPKHFVCIRNHAIHCISLRKRMNLYDTFAPLHTTEGGGTLGGRNVLSSDHIYICEKLTRQQAARQTQTGTRRQAHADRRTHTDTRTQAHADRAAGHSPDHASHDE